MTKVRRYISLDPVVDDYFREVMPNLSNFINDIGLELIEMDMIDDTDVTLMARERVLRLHKEALAKEIFELQRQCDVIEETLEKSEENRNELWQIRLDSLRKHSRARQLRQNHDDE